MTGGSGLQMPEGDVLQVPRLLLLQAAIACVLSIVVGAAVAVQFSTGLEQFGGLEYGPRVVVLSAVRALGSGVSAQAALFAMVAWTHRVDAGTVTSRLLRGAPWVAVAALLATPVTISLTAMSGLVTLHWLYDVPWSGVAGAPEALDRSDLLAAGLTWVRGALFAGVFLWFVVPLMSRRSWSLLCKLGMTWATFALLRTVFDIVAVSFSWVMLP